MLQHTVSLPLGVVNVRLERRGLTLVERGGFEAAWSLDTATGLDREAYRAIVKAHLHDVYLAKEGREPSSIPLNLASHQLLDDIEGWTKLNFHTKPGAASLDETAY